MIEAVYLLCVEVFIMTQLESRCVSDAVDEQKGELKGEINTSDWNSFTT